MNGGQYEGILNLLVEIRDRMPEPPAPVAKPLTVHHLDGTSTTSTAPRTGWPHERYGPALVPAGSGRVADPSSSGAASCRRTLGLVLLALDGWIQGAKENHEALGHRNENTGEECWRTFAPSDFRSMVNDVARELGLTEFPAPPHPEEDKAL